MVDLRVVRMGGLVALATACSATAPRTASPGSDATGDPAPWAPPGAHMFAQGVISTGDAIQPSFARDGRTVYFVKTGHLRDHTRIMTARLDRGAWTAPEPAPFGDAAATEYSPFVAPDGAIYFCNGAPVDATVGRLQATRAIYRTLLWTEGTFEIDFREVDQFPD